MNPADQCFYNTRLTRKHALQLNELIQNKTEFCNYCSEAFKLDHYEPVRREIYLDFLYNLYKYCYDLSFSAEKLSTALSIAIYVFNESLEKKMGSTDSYELLEKILKRHISQREPFSYGFFTQEEKKQLLKFLRDSFYRHYVLYEIAMTKFVDYTLQMVDYGHASFPDLISLNEGTEIDPEKIPYFKERFFRREETEEKAQEGIAQTESKEPDALSRLKTPTPKEVVPTFVFEKTEDDLKTEKDIEMMLSNFKGSLSSQIKEKDEEFSKSLAQLTKKGGKR